MGYYKHKNDHKYRQKNTAEIKVIKLNELGECLDDMMATPNKRSSGIQSLGVTCFGPEGWRL